MTNLDFFLNFCLIIIVISMIFIVIVIIIIGIFTTDCYLFIFYFFICEVLMRLSSGFCAKGYVYILRNVNMQ